MFDCPVEKYKMEFRPFEKNNYVYLTFWDLLYDKA